jgi:hypothetical protein
LGVRIDVFCVGGGNVNRAELVLVIQALREAASYTRVAERRQAYLLLAGKLKGELDGKRE